MKNWALTTSAVALLAGCTADNPTFASFFGEAGSYTAVNPTFGAAVVNNANVMINGQNAMIDLNARFAAAVPTTINFAFNSAVIDASAAAILSQQADFIRQFPELRFKVFGHTDLVGSNAYNQGLGQRRANAAVNYLVARGISRGRLQAVVSFGETQPLIATPAPERANRRTVTEVTGWVSNHPNIMNGRYAEVIFREYLRSAEVPATTMGVVGEDAAAGG